jgi:putative glycosyltransferase (TIGR04348 family)
MRIAIVTPAARGSRKGNRVTALRWAGLLRALGHRAVVSPSWQGEPCDVLVALHATRSHPSILRFRERHPAAPLVVAMAGTDLYEDLPASEEARRSLELATRVTVLQPLGILRLPPAIRERARVLLQSARAVPAAPAPEGVLQACVLAHLRAVKAPLLAAQAAARLPARSRWSVVHLGAPLDEESAARARAEEARNPRYAWRGERRRREALGVLAGSAALLVTSRLEGGSNAVSEAVAAGVPVLSTRVDGSVGVLGEDYPGYFAVGDADGLAALLVRVEEDAGLRARLLAGIARARPLVEPAREREAWARLLAEL